MSDDFVKIRKKKKGGNWKKKFSGYNVIDSRLFG